MATDDASGLTPAQEQAIVALLNETTVRKAAEACGIGERSMHRYLEDPAFMRAYRKARAESFKQAVGQAQKYAPVALNVLLQIAADTKAPPNARVSAATGLLKFGRESLEMDDLAARVQALEQVNKPPGAAA